MKRINLSVILFVITAALMLTINCVRNDFMDILGNLETDDGSHKVNTAGTISSDDGRDDPLITDDPIENLRVSRMDSTKDITLIWDVKENAATYQIYRHLNLNDTSPDIFTTAVNYYDDASAADNVPYFYRVTYTDTTGDELGQTDFAFGIHSDVKDGYEDNELMGDVSEGGTSPILNIDQTVLIYSCRDGDGGLETDTDWYKYHGPVKTIFVDITLDDETDFNDGDLKIQFYFDGTYGPAQDIETGVLNTYEYSNFGSATGDVDLFFKVYVDEGAIDDTRNFVEKYTVKLRDSM